MTGWFRKAATAVLTLLFLAGLSGCAAKHMPDWSSAPVPRGPSQHMGEWESLQQLDRGERVAVYQKDGRVIREAFLYVPAAEIFLESHSVSRGDVVAVTRVPNDPNWDGTLMGLGIGAALGAVTGAVANDVDDVDPLSMALWGLILGPGPGALLDVGIAKREKLLFRREHGSQSVRDEWTFSILPSQVSGWILSREIHLMLADGSYFEGKALQGNAHEVELAVRDSSQENRKGTQMRIPTSSISTVSFKEERGGHFIPAAVGGGLASFLLGGIWMSLAEFPNEGTGTAMSAGAGALLGAIVGGTLADRRKWREITLLVRPLAQHYP